jgi:hypothetical protein
MKTIVDHIRALALAVIVIGAAASCNRHETPSYTVAATAGEGGTATATPAAARPGETVTLTAVADEGFLFAGWTVEAGDAELSGALDNPATFTMPEGAVAVGARFEARSTEGALWHEGIEAWIVPQADPYALDNVRAAAAGLAARGETRAVAVAATHRALRIFPRTEDEQWEMEKTRDITLSYIPFDRLALTEKEAEELEQEARTTRAGDRPLFEEPGAHTDPYGETVTIIDSLDVKLADDVLDIPEEEKLPVLYAVWPVDKALPDGYDYETDYEVWLPAAAVQTRGGAMDAATARDLENEAIRLALGDAAAADAATRAGGARTRAGTTLSGEFWEWEALREVQAPVPNVRVKFHLGSNIVETTADEQGRFSVTADAIPAAASWDIVFQTPEFKVTRNTSTVPKFFVQGNVYQSNWWSADETHVSHKIGTFDAAIIRALSYYYYTPHELSKWTVPDGIRVIAHNNSSGSYNGLFTYSSLGVSYITVYRNNTSNVNFLMGTVLHELGHFVHFRERGGYANMKVTDRFLAESFASYSGWWLTERYYRELGYEKSPGEDISGQARQTSWRSTTSGDWGYYSPLFVDLVDDYNQSARGDAYNDDRVKLTSPATIMRIAKESDTWESCKAILRADAPLAAQGLDAFLTPYEYWYGHK